MLKETGIEISSLIAAYFDTLPDMKFIDESFIMGGAGEKELLRFSQISHAQYFQHNTKKRDYQPVGYPSVSQSLFISKF